MGNKQVGGQGQPQSQSLVVNNQQKIGRRRSELREIRRMDSVGGSSKDGLEKSQSNGAAGGGGSVRQHDKRRWSSTAVISARGNPSIKPKRMTARQFHLIIKSWNRRMPKNRVVRDIFVDIFEEADELKPLFGIDRTFTGKKLRADSRFIRHTNMFADTLEFVIRNLDDISLVTENAEQLGRRHATFQTIGSNLRTEHWNLFTECIIENAGKEEDKETQIAWRQIVQTIVYYMKLGYDREILQMQRNSQYRRSKPPNPQSTPRFDSIDNKQEDENS